MNKIQKRDLLGFFCYFLILAAIFCIAVFVYRDQLVRVLILITR